VCILDVFEYLIGADARYHRDINIFLCHYTKGKVVAMARINSVGALVFDS
jgi:hypothetical protein